VDKYSFLEFSVLTTGSESAGRRSVSHKMHEKRNMKKIAEMLTGTLLVTDTTTEASSISILPRKGVCISKEALK
jgi:hypothetical protein